MKKLTVLAAVMSALSLSASAMDNIIELGNNLANEQNNQGLALLDLDIFGEGQEFVPNLNIVPSQNNTTIEINTKNKLPMGSPRFDEFVFDDFSEDSNKDDIKEIVKVNNNHKDNTNYVERFVDLEQNVQNIQSDVNDLKLEVINIRKDVKNLNQNMNEMKEMMFKMMSMMNNQNQNK